MATIRTQFRGMFAISITLLLLLCSGSIWLWARYIIREQAQVQIQRDVKRLRAEIEWQPEVGAFELRSATALPHILSSTYWQITDESGRLIWWSDSWRGFKGTP